MKKEKKNENIFVPHIEMFQFGYVCKNRRSKSFEILPRTSENVSTPKLITPKVSLTAKTGQTMSQVNTGRCKQGNVCHG